MNIHVYSSEDQATHAATQWLTAKLLEPTTRNIMVAGGRTPLGIYAKIAAQNRSCDHWTSLPWMNTWAFRPNEPTESGICTSSKQGGLQGATELVNSEE